MDLYAVSDKFLHATTPLTPKAAVAAIIVTEDRNVLLQLRDDKEEIFFPHHWGFFGGAIEHGEEPAESLLRELEEELAIGFAPDALEQFTTITFTVNPASPKPIDRFFFVVKTTRKAMEKARLGEGHSFGLFSWQRAMALANITPYDKFALWLYFNDSRFT